MRFLPIFKFQIMIILYLMEDFFFFFFLRMGNWILAQKKKEGYWIYMHFIPKQKRKEKIV